MLMIRRLSKRFGGLQALDSLSLTLDDHQLVGFVGANGAGKSTAMRIVMGALAPDAGAVTWNGAPVDARIRRRIGYMPEERGLYPRMRVGEQLTHLARLHGIDAATARRAGREWTERLGIARRRDDEVQRLSLGNQQRVQLAAALVGRPDLLILDEPFSGLDPMAVDVMSAVLRECARSGVPALFSSHQLDLVERLCDRVVIIRSGRLVAEGTIDRLRATAEPRWRAVVETDDSPDAAADAARALLAGVPDPRVTAAAHDRGARLELSAGGPDEQPLRRAAEHLGRLRELGPVHRPLTEIFREALAAPADEAGRPAGPPEPEARRVPQPSRRPESMSSSRTATPRSTMPRGAEIRLVAARELRAQLLKRSSLAATIVLLVITVGGILAHSYVTGDDEEPYRLGVLMAGAADATDPADATDSIEPAEAGAHASTSVLEQIKGIKDSKERPIEVVDLSGARPEAALGIDDGAPESPGGAAGTVDMVLDLTGETPGLLVSRSENSDSAVVAAVTNILQQAALSDQVTALGGDPATTAGALAQAAPRVEALDPPRYDSEDFGARYATLGLIDILMIIVIMGGGQTIAMGVVEEKSSRIVEILLACVRPGSLLTGKILGTGAAAELTGVLPEALFSIDAVVVAMIVWMIVGYAIAAAAYGAAGARPSPPRPLAPRSVEFRLEIGPVRPGSAASGSQAAADHPPTWCEPLAGARSRWPGSNRHRTAGLGQRLIEGFLEGSGARGSVDEMGEPDRDLALGRLRRVGAVDEVHHGRAAPVAAQIAADGPRGRSGRLGGADEGAQPLDHPMPLDDDGDQRAAGHVLHDAGVEGLVDVLRVVLGQHVGGRHEAVERDDLVALGLDAAQDLPGQPASDGVGLDEDEHALGGVGHGESFQRESRRSEGATAPRRPRKGPGRQRVGDRLDWQPLSSPPTPGGHGQPISAPAARTAAARMRAVESAPGSQWPAERAPR